MYFGGIRLMWRVFKRLDGREGVKVREINEFKLWYLEEVNFIIGWVYWWIRSLEIGGGS